MLISFKVFPAAGNAPLPTFLKILKLSLECTFLGLHAALLYFYGSPLLFQNDALSRLSLVLGITK